MRKITFIVLTILLSIGVFGQETDGYYITKTGDTIWGKIKIPIEPKLKLAASSQTLHDPLKDEAIDEAKDIEYSKLTFDFKFSDSGEKFKKIDRLKVKGFGFAYEGHQYDFVTWDVTANKQLYLIPATGDVAPDGVYFILRSVNGQLPIYSLFQEIEMTKKTWDNGAGPDKPAIRKTYDGNATKRDIIFKHPTKGFIYISNQYPLKMKFSAALEYLELEEEFIMTVAKKDNLFDVVKKYNKWKVDK